MPTYEPPRSDLERVAFLQRAAATGAQDLAAGNAYVSQSRLDAIAGLLPQFETATQSVNEKLSARMKESRERTAAIDKVQSYTRDLWEVVKRRAQRLEQPREVLAYYGLPQDGVIPNPGTQEEWLVLADRVVQGDAKAVAAGYPAMVNPGAAELQAVLTAARNAANEVAGADRGYDQIQEQVATLRTQADEQVAEVMAELRYNLRNLDGASQRRIMRTYGARFRALPGEPPDPEEPLPGEGA